MIKNTLFLCTAGPDSLDRRIFGILLLLSKPTPPVEREESGTLPKCQREDSEK